MKITEILNEDVAHKGLYNKYIDGYTSPEDDNSVLSKDDLRKTKLTLLQINKLRKMNDVRNYEMKLKIDAIQQQYGPQASGDDSSDDLGF